MPTDMLYKENEMKDTSLGMIPRDWTVATLNSLARLIMGQSPPSSTYNKEGEGPPFLQGKKEFGDIYPSPVVFCSNPLRIAEQNDILMSVRAPVGDVNLAPYKLCIGRGLAAIRFHRKVANHVFYFYILQLLKSSIERLGKGSTFKALVRADLENLHVVLPPHREQQRIAEILSRVDEAIQKTNEIIAATERLKKGLMQQLLTKGIGHKEFKDTEIGRIAKDWNVVTIKTLGEVITGTTPSTSEKSYWNGEVPFVTPTDFSENKYVDETERKVTRKGAERGRLIPKDSVLVVCIGSTIGKIALSFTKCITNQQINAIACRDGVNPHYVYYALAQRKGILRAQAGITAKPIVNKSLFEKFALPLPPSMSEQKKIGSILSKVDRKLELERSEKAKLEKAKQGLMDLLLTGKIRIKVD